MWNILFLHLNHGSPEITSHPANPPAHQPPLPSNTHAWEPSSKFTSPPIKVQYNQGCFHLSTENAVCNHTSAQNCPDSQARKGNDC